RPPPHPAPALTARMLMPGSCRAAPTSGRISGTPAIGSLPQRAGEPAEQAPEHRGGDQRGGGEMTRELRRYRAADPCRVRRAEEVRGDEQRDAGGDPQGAA